MKIFNLQCLFLIAIISNANTLMIQPNPFGAGLALLEELPQILGQLHQIHELKQQQEQQNQQPEQPVEIEKSIHIPRFENPFHFVKVFSQQMVNNNNGMQERKIHKVVQFRRPDGQLMEKDIDRTVTPQGVITQISRHPVETLQEEDKKPSLFDALFQPKRDIQEEQDPNQQEDNKPHGFMFEISIPIKKLTDDNQNDNNDQEKEVQDNDIEVNVEDKDNKLKSQQNNTDEKVEKIYDESDEEKPIQIEEVKQSTTQEQDNENFDIPKLFDHLTFPKVHKEKHPKDVDGLFDLLKGSPFDNINEEESIENIIPIKKHKKKHHRKNKIENFNPDDILNMFVDEPKHHKKRRRQKKNKLNKMEKEEVHDLIDDIVKSGNKKKLIDFLEKQDDKLIDDQLINESVKKALNDQIVGTNDIYDRKLRAITPEKFQVNNPGLLSKSKIKAQFNYQ